MAIGDAEMIGLRGVDILVVESSSRERALIVRELQDFIPNGRIEEAGNVTEALTFIFGHADWSQSSGSDPASLIIAGDGEQASITGALLESVGYRVSYAHRSPTVLWYGGDDMLEPSDVAPHAGACLINSLEMTVDAGNESVEVEDCPARNSIPDPMVETVRALFSARQVLETSRREIAALRRSLVELQSQYSREFQRSKHLTGALALVHNASAIDDGNRTVEREVFTEVVSALATGVIRDLKHPLEGILHHFRIVKREDCSPRQTTAALSVIEANAKRMATIVRKVGCIDGRTGEFTGSANESLTETYLRILQLPLSYGPSKGVQRRRFDVDISSRGRVMPPEWIPKLRATESPGGEGTFSQSKVLESTHTGIRKTFQGCIATVHRRKDKTPFELEFPSFHEIASDALVETVRSVLLTRQQIEKNRQEALSLFQNCLDLRQEHFLLFMRNEHLVAEIFESEEISHGEGPEGVTRKYSKVASELAGAIKHELNQPLTVIIGRIQLMKRSEEDAKEVTRHMALIEDQVNRMAGIIHKIGCIREYVTRPYMQGKHIIDIEAAAKPGRVKIKRKTTLPSPGAEAPFLNV